MTTPDRANPAISASPDMPVTLSSVFMEVQTLKEALWQLRTDMKVQQAGERVWFLVFGGIIAFISTLTTGVLTALILKKVL